MRSMIEPALEKSTPKDRDGLSVDAYFVRQIGEMRRSIAEEGKYLAHTSYLGDGANEANSRFQKYLVLLSADECVSLLRRSSA